MKIAIHKYTIKANEYPHVCGFEDALVVGTYMEENKNSTLKKVCCSKFWKNVTCKKCLRMKPKKVK